MLKSQRYNFKAQPRLVKPRSKYRQESGNIRHLAPKVISKHHNLMFEKRVIRGNTYSSQFRTTLREEKMVPIKQSKKKITKKKENFEDDYIPVEFDPEIMRNRTETGVMTDKYREILTDKPDMRESETQTELLLNKPAQGQQKKYVQNKDMKTVSTQIVEEDNLFDFEEEVEPIVNVLITRILEQSRMEVLEEEELKMMKEQKRQYLQLKNAELAEVQRLEENENRLENEMGRRNNQSNLVIQKRIGVHRQLVARVFSKSYLRHLNRDSLDCLDEVGHFTEDNTAQMHSIFTPWLYDEVIERLVKVASYNEAVGRMAQQFEDNIIELHIQSLENKERDEMKIKEGEEDRLRKKQEKREKKKDDRERLMEEERLETLRNQLETLLLRENHVKSRSLSISDCNGIDGTIGREIVGLPGGIMLELYLIFDVLKKLSEKNELNFTEISPAIVSRVLSQLVDSWISNEFVFELGYLPEMDDILLQKKEELFGEAEVNLADIQDMASKIEGEERKALLKKIISNYLTFFYYEITKRNTSSRPSKELSFTIQEEKEETELGLKPDDMQGSALEPTINELTKEDAVLGSISKDETTQQLQSEEEGMEDILELDLEIDQSWKGFSSDLLAAIREGITNALVDGSDKIGKVFKLRPFVRELPDLDNYPPLCILEPLTDEERLKMEKQREEELDNKSVHSEEFNDRDWMDKTEKVPEKPVKEFYEKNLAYKACPNPVVTPKMDLLVVNKAFTLNLRKELLKSSLRVAPVILKSETNRQQVLKNLFEMSDVLQKEILQEDGESIDIVVMDGY